MAATPRLDALASIFAAVSFCDALIDHVLRDGSHEALHSLVGIHTGALGLRPMQAIRAAMTPIVRAAARSIYATNHYSSHAAVLAVPGGAVPLPGPVAPAWNQIFSHGCMQCFDFLVRNNIVSVNGFTNTLDGYMLYAAETIPICRPIMSYIADHVAFADYTVPQSLVDPTLTTFVVGLMEEPPMWIILRRIAALVPPALLPAMDLSTWIYNHHFLEMGSWINVPAANALLTFNIHVGEGHDNIRGDTIWGYIIASQNPHRGSMLRWLASQHTNGAWTNIRSSAFGLDPTLPGVWPAWGIAMALGDTVSATILSQVAGIDPLATGLDTTFPMAPVARQLGCAAVYFLEEHNIGMLRHWLVHVSGTISLPGILEVLEFILDRLVGVRGDIDNTPMPFGYAGTINNWERGIWRRKKRKSQIAIRMIKVVLEMGFRRFTASNDQTQMVVSEIMDDLRYQVFLTRIRGQQNQGYYPEIADVIMQLDARPRNTRSGRQLQLDVDD